MAQLETHEIQGIVLSGYGYLPASKYLFLHVNDSIKAKEWLNQLVTTTPEITTCNWNTGICGGVVRPEYAVNIAFTYQGLQKLRLPLTALNTFSQEFIEGMAQPYRSRQLGDTGYNAPQNWEFGGDNTKEGGGNTKKIHILLILNAKSNEIDRLYDKHRCLFERTYAAGTVLLTETGYLPKDRKEHFGFHDSISQPEIEGSPKPRSEYRQDWLKAGEFILGYTNEDGNLLPTPFISEECVEYDRQQNLQLIQTASSNSKHKDLGRNGSYLVFRKLRQDVDGFNQYFERFAEKRELIKAKLIGRWQDGQPLVLAPDSASQINEDADLNDFSYMKLDPHGYRCPLGAHIRRANPRDSITGVRRRRILRRGALYSSTNEQGQEEKGLLFICINADIRRQFEFIQQLWINNSNFNGLNGETDPIIGTNSKKIGQVASSTEDVLRPMTIQKQPIRQRLSLPNFVSVKGGSYFFLPSMATLRFLAAMPD